MNTALNNKLNDITRLSEQISFLSDNKILGEIASLETGEILSQEQLLEDKKAELDEKLSGLEDLKAKDDNTKKYLKSAGEFETFVRDNIGNFHMSNYSYLISQVKADADVKLRFMFLCSYLDYNNKLTTGNTNSKRNIKENELMDLLQLSERETRNTKNALIDAGLISIEEDGSISINRKAAIKGELEKVESKNYTGNSSRVFDESIINLYKSSKPREHKKLFLIIALLPYLNYSHNVICSNPEESVRDEIKMLEVRDIALILGYDEAHAYRFKKDILSIKINDEFLFGVIQTGDRQRVLMNPRLFYKGKDLEAMQDIIIFFKAK